MRIVKPGEPCPCCGAPIWEAHGPGCLAVVSAKTARRKDRRISDDVLRQICAGRKCRFRTGAALRKPWMRWNRKEVTLCR